MIFLQWDEKDNFRKTTSVYHLPDNESFTNEENYKLRYNKFSNFGKLNYQCKLRTKQTNNGIGQIIGEPPQTLIYLKTLTIKKKIRFQQKLPIYTKYQKNSIYVLN